MFRGAHFSLLLSALVAGGQISAELIDGEELVDPTRPFNITVSVDTGEALEIFRTVVPESFELSFVRAGGGSSLAVINGQSVKVGDLVGGARVIVIDRNGVTLLTGDDEERRIGLSSTNIKPTLTTC